MVRVLVMEVMSEPCSGHCQVSLRLFAELVLALNNRRETHLFRTLKGTSCNGYMLDGLICPIELVGRKILVFYMVYICSYLLK